MVKAVLFDLGNTLFDLGPVKSGDLFRAGALRTYEYLRVRGHALPSFSKYYREFYPASCGTTSGRSCAGGSLIR